MDGLSNFWSSEQNAGCHENIRFAWPDKTNIRFGDALRFSPPRKQFWLFLRLRDGYTMATTGSKETFAVEIAPLSVREMNFPRGGKCISRIRVR